MSIVVEKLNTETIVIGYVVSVAINSQQEYLYGIFNDIEEAKKYAGEMSANFVIKIKSVHAPSLH